MAINKAEQSLEAQLVNTIKRLEDEMLQLKTHLQPMGADQLDVRTGTTVTVGPVTLTAGSSLTSAFTTQPVSDFVLTLFNFEVTAFVDTYDNGHKYSDGSSLTSGQRNMRFEAWHDWQDSYSDLANFFVRCYKVRIVNTDSVSHDYYIKYLAIFPKFTTT